VRIVSYITHRYRSSSMFVILSVGLSVCPFGTTVYFGKTADSIEILFGVVGRVVPGNDVSDRSPDPAR